MTTDDCVFCNIVSGDAPATIVDRTETTLALVPRTPESPGHLLVIPQAHYESLFDIPESELAAVSRHAKTLAVHFRELGFDGANVLHASGEAAQQSVPHFHLAPRRADDDFDLWPDVRGEGSHDDDIYDQLQAELESVRQVENDSDER